MIDHEHRIEVLEGQVDDLRWRMNSLCNFISRHFPELVDRITAMYMVEEVKCQHESDGYEYENHYPGGKVSIIRCKKCGEFYR